jgi:mannan endo-1,4-beta-mannosidase
MRRLLLPCSLALFAASACTGPATGVSELGRTHANAPFVRIENGRFTAGGEPHRVVGANFWAAMNLGSPGPGGDSGRLERELDRLAALGINNVRILAASEGPNGSFHRVSPTLMPAPGEHDPDLLVGLDRALAEAGERGIRVVMVLNNFWDWSGGMAQYVAWSENEEVPRDLPFPAYTEYASRFYASAQCQRWYRAHIEAIVGRTNSITGVPYRDDPTIFAWELANEPRLYPAAWIDETAAFLESLDPNHLVTTGSEGEIGGPFAATHDGPDIDYACAHLWPQNWDWYDPKDPATLEAGLNKARDYVHDHMAKAHRLGKPLVLEEFGLARDTSTGDHLDPAAPTTHRDRFFRTVFELVEASVIAGGALQGDNFWAGGGEGRPPGPWLGDPPHEPAGWYSVYDVDASTLQLLRDHANALNGR